MLLILCACVCLQNADYFALNVAALEDGKGKCPYDPAKGHTGLIVGELKCVGVHTGHI